MGKGHSFYGISGSRDDRESPGVLPILPVISGVLLLLGMAVTGWGLSIVRSRLEFGWLPRQVRVLAVTYLLNNQAVIVGGLIALAGAVLAGLVVRKALPDKLSGLTLPSPSLRRDPYALGALGLAAVCNALLYWRLATNQYAHWDIALFFTGLALVGLAVHRLDKSGRASTLNFRWFDAAAVPALASFAAVVNSIDLTRWNFAWWSDEGEFFDAAYRMLNDKDNPWRFFDLTWVYGAHPTLDTIYQALCMKIFGADVFGWRFGEVLVVSAGAALMYLLGTALWGRLPGIVAGVVLASSHYLMAFTRHGYNNTHAIFYAVLAVLMLVLAWRTQRAVFVFATGLGLGFCLYTFQIALLIWPVVAMLLLTVFFRRPTREQVSAGALILLGVALVITPALLTTPPSELAQVAARNTYGQVAAKDPARIVRISLVHSTLVFWDNYQFRSHYVGGPLVDPITGLMLVIGLATAVFRIHKRAERLAFLWFAGGLLMIAFTRLTPEAHLTRLLFLMPAVALLAALAACKLEVVLTSGLRLPAAAARVLVAALVALVVPLNLYQLLVDTPSKAEANYQIMVIKALQEHLERVIVEIGDKQDEHVALVVSLYPWLRDRYRFADVSELEKPQPDGPSSKLPIYLVSGHDDTFVDIVAGRVPKGYKLTRDADPPGANVVWLFMPDPHRP